MKLALLGTILIFAGFSQCFIGYHSFDQNRKNILSSTHRGSHVLCSEKWFDEDLELFLSDNWEETFASFSGIKIKTMLLPDDRFPYYRYDLHFKNVSMDFLYLIEGPGYAEYVHNWIPQTIEGYTVECDMKNKKLCQQYLAFSFFPLPFSDRDVCQIVCPKKDGDVIQLAIRTIPFERCSNDGITTAERIHMIEKVGKLIWKKNDEVFLTYFGQENPEGDFPPWFMKLTYPWAYLSHIHNYIAFIQKN